MNGKTRQVLPGVVLLLATVTLGRAEPNGPARPTRVCAVAESWASKDRNVAHLLEILDQAAVQRAEVVCLPQDCVPTDGGPSAKAALDAIAKAAAERKMYVAANLKEKDGGELYLTSYLLGPDGKLIGKYRKSHRLPDEDITLGNALPVFDTPLGKIGLMIGTDHYWPEIPLVMALEGAELILVSLGVEPVPQGFPLEITLRARALDDHVTLVCSNYAGDLPYLCSNHPAYAGEPLGRGCVIDRSGILIADTGIRPGVAVAPVDLTRRKDIYHLSFKEYWCDSVCTAEIDLDAGPIWFARSDTPGRAGQRGYLAGYYPKTIPEKRTDFRSVLLAGRRPELYGSITEKTLAHRIYSEEVQKRMAEPRR